MSPFKTSRIIEFCDTDMAGIVHFSNFFRFMEAAEHAFLRSRGLSVVTEWQGEKVSFPRVSATCDYKKPILFQEKVDIFVQVEKVGRSSVTYAFDFFKSEDLIAHGKITAVLCRVRPGQGMEPIEIPKTIRQALLG